MELLHKMKLRSKSERNTIFVVDLSSRLIRIESVKLDLKNSDEL